MPGARRWRTLRTLLAALTTLVAVGVLASPAHAVDGEFNIPAQSSRGGGGKVWGTYTFTSKYSFTYAAQLKDICPGDDLGVSFIFAINTKPAANSYTTDVRGLNQAGCDHTSGTSGTINSPYKIDNMQVLVYFTNGSNWTYEFGAGSALKDNPYVS